MPPQGAEGVEGNARTAGVFVILKALIADQRLYTNVIRFARKLRTNQTDAERSLLPEVPGNFSLADYVAADWPGSSSGSNLH